MTRGLQMCLFCIMLNEVILREVKENVRGKNHEDQFWKDSGVQYGTHQLYSAAINGFVHWLRFAE